MGLNDVSRLFHGAWRRFLGMAGGVVAKKACKAASAPFSEAHSVLKLEPGEATVSEDGKTIIVNRSSQPLFVAQELKPETEAVTRLAAQLMRAERERVMDAFYDRNPSREAKTIAEAFINRAKGE